MADFQIGFSRDFTSRSRLALTQFFSYFCPIHSTFNCLFSNITLARQLQLCPAVDGGRKRSLGIRLDLGAVREGQG
jgi:hypothetical protein